MPGRTDLLQDEYLRREGNKPDEFRYFWPDDTEFTDADGLARIAALPASRMLSAIASS